MSMTASELSGAVVSYMPTPRGGVKAMRRVLSDALADSTYAGSHLDPTRYVN
jgi:hypothetical protein